MRAGPGLSTVFMEGLVIPLLTWYTDLERGYLNVDLKQKATDYLEHLQFNRRVTGRSLVNYRSTVIRFVTFARANKRDLNGRSVNDFLRPYKEAATANTNLVRLQGFAEFCGVDLHNVTRAVEPVKEVQALDSGEIAALVDAAAKFDPHLPHVITFLVETGLRYHEFAALTPQSVQRRRGVPMIQVLGKGQKERLVPLSPEALGAFKELSFEFNHYFYKKLCRGLARAARKAKIIGVEVTPHTMRRSMISIHLNEKGTEAVIVAKIVGHASVDTMLKHYLKASLDTLYKAVA